MQINIEDDLYLSSTLQAWRQCYVQCTLTILPVSNSTSTTQFRVTSRFLNSINWSKPSLHSNEQTHFGQTNEHFWCSKLCYSWGFIETLWTCTSTTQRTICSFAVFLPTFKSEPKISVRQRTKIFPSFWSIARASDAIIHQERRQLHNRFHYKFSQTKFKLKQVTNQKDKTQNW